MFKYYLSALFTLFICSNNFAQGNLAITIDDPNTYTTPLLSWKERNERILGALDLHKIKAALFVCGQKVNDTAGKLLIKEWDEKGHMIGNHSYSHLNFNAKSMTGAIFIRDFIKGDSIINSCKNNSRYFRFPFLKEGNTVNKRDSMRMVLQQSGYKNGYVTIDASDWYIDAQMTGELKNNPNADLTAYKEYYLRHITNRAQYYDSLATILFHRKISHTLLLHHSLLNALFLDDLLTALSNQGWHLMDAKEAYTDSVFTLQPGILPCGESIIWQCAKSDENLSKTLRYPAEDSQYEALPLQKALEEYHDRRIEY